MSNPRARVAANRRQAKEAEVLDYDSQQEKGFKPPYYQKKIENRIDREQDDFAIIKDNDSANYNSD